MRHDLSLAQAAPILAFLLNLSSAVVGGEPQYRWRQSGSSLALESGKRTAWQCNFSREEGKSFFHPITLTNGTTITSLRPQDHPWHCGLWWSWKFINGVNYWEESRKTGLSDGLTELISTTVDPGSNFSARIEMELSYHPPGKEPVMREHRVLDMSAPDAKGDYFIDWSSHFTAGAENVKLDRTPPRNFAGGYGGLSCRLSKECSGWTYSCSEGMVGATNIYGKVARWVDLSRNGVGIAILDHPANPRHPTAWYPNENMPFFSPTFLFHEPCILAAGKQMTLRYRVFVHSSPADSGLLENAWRDFAAEKAR